LGRENVSVNFDKLVGSERGLEIEIRQVDRPKGGIGRDNRIKKDVDTGEGGDKGGGGDGRLKTVAAGGASNPPVDVRVVGAVRAG
jgi:hypothetical protein